MATEQKGQSNKQDFTTTLLVDETPEEVFKAVTNVRGWWSEDIDGYSEKLGDVFEYLVPDVHYAKMQLVEVIPNKRVVWLVTDSALYFVDNQSEWTGTRVIFDISKEGNKTKLVFTHQGLTPQLECFDACKPAWTDYVQDSLSSLITTGTGDPNLEGRKIKVPDRK